MSEVQKFDNINPAVINKYGVRALADRPNVSGAYGKAGMSPEQLKVHFDKMVELLVGKFNILQDSFAKEDIAQYIRISLDKYGVGTLEDLIGDIVDGDFAAKLLMANPTVNSEKKMPIQEVIYEINRKIDLLAEGDTAEAYAELVILLAEVKRMVGGAALPSVSEKHNGQFLRVVDGKWSIVNLGLYGGEVR